jgi:phosphoglycolate phosphatase-like HAD superfamily hydrolase
LRAGGFDAVIFDVDGTLVDSNDAHARAFQEVFAESGLQIPFAEIRRLIGVGADKLIPLLAGRYDEELAERKKALFRERYLPSLRPFPKVRDLLEALRQRHLRLAVASSAGKDELHALLSVAGARPTSRSRPTPTTPSAPSPTRTSCRPRWRG